MKEKNNEQSKRVQGRSSRKSSASKYVGVFLDKDHGLKKWSGRICGHYLGHFHKEEDAALAYDKKAIELFGLEAKRNFPDLSVDELMAKVKRIHTNKEDKDKMVNFLSKAHQGTIKNQPKTSQYVGVSRMKDQKKCWCVEIAHQKKHYHLGCYYIEEEAALVYDEKARELFGETAKLNFPDISAEELTKVVSKIREENVHTPDDISKGNQGVPRNRPKTSKYVGVSFRKEKKSKQWTGYISYQKKSYFLGYFNTEKEAAKAYDKKAKELYGEDARLNLPDGD